MKEKLLMEMKWSKGSLDWASSHNEGVKKKDRMKKKMILGKRGDSRTILREGGGGGHF